MREINKELLRINFFQGKELFFKIFYFIKKCKNEIEDTNEKISVDSAVRFLIKSILRQMVFTETTR